MEKKFISIKKEFLKCPQCLAEIQNINSKIRLEKYELKEFCCNNCNKFIFILCHTVIKKFFLKKIQMAFL